MIRIEIQYYTDQDYAFDLLDDDNDSIKAFKVEDDLIIDQIINHDLTCFRDEDGMNVSIKAKFSNNQKNEMLGFLDFVLEHTRGRVRDKENWKDLYATFESMFIRTKLFIANDLIQELKNDMAKIVRLDGDGNYEGTRIIISKEPDFNKETQLFVEE